MKRIITIAALAALPALTASILPAQVIGTYRPSVVTYYSASRVQPVGYQQQVNYQQPIAAANYAPVSNYTSGGYQYVGAHPVQTTPITTVASTRVTRNVPITPVGYGQPVSTSYYASPLRTVSHAGAPCHCGGVARTAYAPPITTVAAPPVALPTPPSGTIDNKYYVGRGLLGRPKVFKNGQPVRNFVRRILP